MISDGTKWLLASTLLVYSLFTCFIMNVFGIALSYDPPAYEWNIRNIQEAKKAVFNCAILHFFLFLAGGYFRIRILLERQRESQGKKKKYEALQDSQDIQIN